MQQYVLFYCVFLSVGYSLLITFTVLFYFGVIDSSAYTTGMVMSGGFSVLMCGNWCISLYAMRVTHRDDVQIRIVPLPVPSPVRLRVSTQYCTDIEQGREIAIGKPETGGDLIVMIQQP